MPHLSHPRQVMDLLNYQFFVILGFGSAPVVQVCEREFGITRHEWGFVGLLAALGPVAPSELALHAGMDRSRTSKALMPLVAKGLVDRRTVAGDRRRSVVALTSEGQRLHQRLFVHARDVHGQMLIGFSPCELAALADFLRRIHANACGVKLMPTDQVNRPGDEPQPNSQRET